MSGQIQQSQSQIQLNRPPTRSLGAKVGDCFRNMCCCFGGQDDDSVESVRAKRPLVISSPTNFRRESLNLAGLTPEQEKFIREKRTRDAEKMWGGLRPLACSPSGTFAERPPTASLPTFEQFTQPRSAPSPHSQSSRMDRVMAHGRKLSDTFRHSLGTPGSVGSGGAGGPYHAVSSRDGSESLELRALTEGSPAPGIAGTAKMSEDSFSRTTMTEESSAERELDAKKGIDAKL